MGNPMGELQVLFGDLPAELVRLAGDGDQVKGKVPRKYIHLKRTSH